MADKLEVESPPLVEGSSKRNYQQMPNVNEGQVSFKHSKATDYQGQEFSLN